MQEVKDTGITVFICADKDCDETGKCYVAASIDNGHIIRFPERCPWNGNEIKWEKNDEYAR